MDKLLQALTEQHDLLEIEIERQGKTYIVSTNLPGFEVWIPADNPLEEQVRVFNRFLDERLGDEADF